MEEVRGLPTKEKLVDLLGMGNIDLLGMGNVGLPGMGKEGPSMREGCTMDEDCLFCKREVAAGPNNGQGPMHG